MVRQTEKKPISDIGGPTIIAEREKPPGMVLRTAIFEMAGQYEKFAVKNVVPISTAEYPTPVKRPANSVLDCSKIERAFRHPAAALAGKPG